MYSSAGQRSSRRSLSPAVHDDLTTSGDESDRPPSPLSVTTQHVAQHQTTQRRQPSLLLTSRFPFVPCRLRLRLCLRLHHFHLTRRRARANHTSTQPIACQHPTVALTALFAGSKQSTTATAAATSARARKQLLSLAFLLSHIAPQIALVQLALQPHPPTRTAPRPCPLPLPPPRATSSATATTSTVCSTSSSPHLTRTRTRLIAPPLPDRIRATRCAARLRRMSGALPHLLQPQSPSKSPTAQALLLLLLLPFISRRTSPSLRPTRCCLSSTRCLHRLAASVDVPALRRTLLVLLEQHDADMRTLHRRHEDELDGRTKPQTLFARQQPLATASRGRTNAQRPPHPAARRLQRPHPTARTTAQRPHQCHTAPPQQPG